MNPSGLQLVAALALPWLVGWSLLRALGVAPSSDRLAFAGWAWMTGSLATALVVFVWSWCGPDYASPAAPRLALLGLGAAAALVGRRRPRVAPLAPRARAAGSGWGRLVFGLVVAFVLLLTLERVTLATLFPVITDDEAEFWALKAKVLFASGGFGPAFRDAMADPAVYNEDYPNLNPLLQVWMFAHAGEVVHVANRLPIQLFALAQVLVVSAALRRVVRPVLAAALLLCLVAPAEARLQCGLAHGDLAVGLGGLAALDAWLRWRASGSSAWLALAAVGAGLAAWSKNEGVLYLVCAAVAFLACAWLVGSARHRTAGAARAWLALPLGLVALHWAINAWFGFRSGFVANELRDRGIFGLLVEQAPERVPEVLRYYAREILFAPAASNLLLALPLVLLVVFPRRLARREVLVPLLAYAGALAATALVFVGAPHALEWHLQTAAARVTFQLAPVAALCLALASAELGFPWARLGGAAEPLREERSGGTSGPGRASSQPEIRYGGEPHS